MTLSTLTTSHRRLLNDDGDLYEGEVKNDCKNGKGTMRFADGRVFVGIYVNGQMNHGMMTYQDGSTYEGSWFNGMRHGLAGKCVFADGSVYEGGFREGEFHGHGKMAWSDGGWYRGEWQNGDMHGQGKEVRPDGSVRHDGQWIKSQPIRTQIQLPQDLQQKSLIIQLLIQSEIDHAAEKYKQVHQQLTMVQKREISMYVHKIIDEDIIPCLFADLPAPFNKDEFDEVASTECLR